MPGRKRRGFTLLELLIVFIIIAILTAAMLLAQRGSDSSAKAAVIISDLRVMKGSAYLFFVESHDLIPTTGVNYAELLGHFMEHGRIINDPVRYSFYVDNAEDKWWVGVKVKGYEPSRVNGALAAKAKGKSSMTLYGSDDIEVPPPDFSDANIYKEAHAAIWTNAR